MPRTWITVSVIVKPYNIVVAEFSYFSDDVKKDIDPIVRALNNFCFQLILDFDLRVYKGTHLLDTRPYDRASIIADKQVGAWLLSLLHSID